MANFEALAGVLEISDRDGWVSARELNEFIATPGLPFKLYWTMSGMPDWDELESAAQVADIADLLKKPGNYFQIATSDPMDRYAQCAMLKDGTYTLELAVVWGKAYNMRIGYGPQADQLSSHPKARVDDVQALNRIQVIDVVTSWAQGLGLPEGFGGTIHVYG